MTTSQPGEVEATDSELPGRPLAKQPEPADPGPAEPDPAKPAPAKPGPPPPGPAHPGPAEPAPAEPESEPGKPGPPPPDRSSQEPPGPPNTATAPENPKEEHRPGPPRRALLLAVSAGAVGGGLAEWALHDVNPTRWIADRLASDDGTVRVHGGDDSNEARENTLAVWSAIPMAGRVGRVAHYVPVGSSSDDQAGIIRNKLSAVEPESDLVVIDPEHLPGLVEDRLVQALPDDPALTGMLRDEGCFTSLVERCRVGDGDRAPLYALPLNADAPLLVIDLTLFPPDDRRPVVERLARLEQTAQAAEFWRTANTFAEASIGPVAGRRILVQAGSYEGMTVSLVELINAFGGDVKADPTLATPASRAALNQLKQDLPTEMFAQPPGDDPGDENSTLVAMQEHRVPFARLWPSQYRQLLTDTVAEEGGGRAYASVRIPGGVLGGQVVALAHNATARRAAVEVATFLARGQGQSQLFHVGGYVPTLGPVFFENTVKAQLEGIPAALGTAVSRPSIRRYAPWSSAFREQVRLFLLGRPIDLDTGITGNLKAFVTD